MKFLLSIFSFFILCNLHAQYDPCGSKTVQTVATADTLVLPDEIYISIAMDRKSNEEDIIEFENKIKKSLQEIGIDVEEQFAIDHFGSHLSGNFLIKRIKNVRKYVLRAYDIDSAIKSIYALNELGVSDISLLKTGYKDEETLKLSLRSKAVLKARKQAISLVNPLNQDIGKAVNIKDINYEDDVYYIQPKLAGSSIDYESEKYKREVESINLNLEKIYYRQIVKVCFELN